MKLDMLTVSITVFLMAVVPYFLAIYYGKEKFRKLKIYATKTLMEHKMVPDIIEQWGLYYIAIDTRNRKLFYSRYRLNEIEYKTIDLHLLKEVLIQPIIRQVSMNGKGVEILDKLQVILLNFDDTSEIIETYDWEIYYEQDYEMDRARRILAKLNKVRDFNLNAPKSA